MKLTQNAGTLLLATVLALSLAPLAAAQGVPFTVVDRGAYAPMDLSSNGFVARSAQEMRDQRIDRLLSASALAGIDWDQDMVVALVMGPRSSGGHS